MNISSELLEYCLKNTKKDSQELLDLKEDTYKNAHGSVMLSETLVASLLQFLIKISNAKIVLDIGTYTGYSALAMAESLPVDGKVITLEREVQISLGIANKHFKSHKDGYKISLVKGSALLTIPNLTDEFDLVFLDADKLHTNEYFELILPKVKSGGIIIVDDVLWRGLVLTPEADKRAKVLNDFNINISKDNRVENILLPIRHGLNILRVK